MPKVPFSVTHPFRDTKEVTVCDACGDRLVIPPGVYYRGLKLHKGCAEIRRRQDLSQEVLAPAFDEIEESLTDYFDNMGPMSEG